MEDPRANKAPSPPDAASMDGFTDGDMESSEDSGPGRVRMHFTERDGNDPQRPAIQRWVSVDDSDPLGVVICDVIGPLPDGSRVEVVTSHDGEEW